MVYRIRSPSFGPTVYHDEDVDVKRPARVFYDDTRHEGFPRQDFNSSQPTGSHFDHVRFEAEASRANNSTASLNKSVAHEKIDDQRYFNEKGFIFKNNCMKKPFTTEENRPYVDREYYSYSGNGDPQRRPIYHYSPPPRSTSYESTEYGWSRVRHALREPLSEFFGVFILVLFGDGAIAQVVLSQNTKGDWNSVGWGYGIGMMLGVYTAGVNTIPKYKTVAFDNQRLIKEVKFSGANINPAVTLSNCVFRKQPWHTLPIYTIAQTLGAFCAAGIVYANYKLAIDIYEGGVGVRTVPGYSQKPTAGIFATYPTEFMTRTHEFFNEIICAALLMFCIYMLQDKKNMGAGYAMNMARDFGPRLMTYFVGYGNEVWTADHHYFWIPMVAPFLGCLLGAWLYDMFLFTGESPVNTPWMGLSRLIRPRRSDDDYV